MELPRRPSCQEGHLLPMSFNGQPLNFWICRMPDCSYVVSSSPQAVTYHKGHAASSEKQRNEKKWKEFQF
jgi:hypothetical protein